MNYILNTYDQRKLLAGFLMMLFACIPLMGQDDMDIYYSFDMSTLKNADNTRTLEAELYGETDDDRFPVYQAEISFYNVLGDSVVLLGSAKTSEEGIAQLILDADTDYLKDEEGYFTLQAVFEGTDAIEYFEEEVTVKDVNLVMELNEEDGEKIVTVYMHAINAEGSEEPVEESDIYFYVNSMINRMPIYDDWLEEGEYSFEFPGDLPGDKDGNLTIYVRVEDSDDFGNVIQEAKAQWGTGPMLASDKTRKLWSDFGPEWMMVLLSVLMILVWANVIHTIYNLVQIKKEA